MRTFWEPVLGHLGLHFESSGVAWAPFWGLWAALGIHLGGLGSPLGFIFGALGILWRLWGSLRAPLAAQGAQSQIFQLVSLPFWGHVGSMLVKTNENLIWCLIDVFIDVGCFVGLFWEPFWREFGFDLVCFATWRNLEESHGA